MTKREETGSGNSTMVAIKPEVLISQLVEKMETRFQLLTDVFEV